MNNVRKTAAKSLLASSILGLMALSTTAGAVGLGPLQAKSPFGQPLAAEVEIFVTDKEAFEITAVKTADSLTPEGSQTTLTKLNVQIESRGGKQFAVLSSSSSITDPQIVVVVEGDSASGKVRRTYTVSLPVGAMQAERASSVSPQLYSNVIEKGVAPSSSDLVTVDAKNAKALVAIRKIVPKGWKGYAIGDDVKDVGRVTIKATKKPWVAVMNGILESAGIYAEVDWDRKEVSFMSPARYSTKVSKLRAASTKAAAVSGSTQAPSPIKMRPREVDAEVAAPVPKVVTPTWVPLALKDSSAIQVSGRLPESEQVVISAGANILVLEAVAQIAPKGFRVLVREGGINESAIVSWRGAKRGWTVVLNEVLNSTNLRARINFNSKEIEILPPAR